MKMHKHGGDIYHSENCLDFSANCNPLGVPESVKQAIIESFTHLAHYPQVGYEPLKKAIAQYEKCDENYVICGNGAAELIYTLCHAAKPKKALIPAPTFAEYELALESIDCEITYVPLDASNGFTIDQSICEWITEDIDILFLCNPNNPTGILIEREELLKIAQKCKQNDTLLVIDECFLDFVKHPDVYTLLDELYRFENVFLLKAFTKRYAMAGVRLGYGLCSNQDLLDKMKGSVQPWNLSVMAQYAGIAALKEHSYVEEARQIIFEEQEYLKKELTACGLEVFPSTSNYIFFHGPVGLKDKCAKHNVLIRDCSNYTGLADGWYRVAVLLHEENTQLIEVLRHILRDGK
ncbi:MAG: threonine-phosphate decarboxylase CobD [Eubacteriales bacterium]|nr:threonine-phosphate decarboxylase CobD [Eubacteriales bacterium]